MPSNAGRLIVFQKLGSVVADFLPSSVQNIDHERTGFLAHSVGGWYVALASLAANPDLRNEIASKASKTMVERYAFETQNKNFLKFIGSLNTHQKQETKLSLQGI